MRIGINLLFLVAGRGGGIERHARGLLRGFAKVGADHEFVVYTNRDCRGTFELAPNMREIAIDVSGTFRPAKLVYEQTLLPIRTRALDVLLSPGNIAPVVHRCRSAVIVHDLIPFRRPEMFDTAERLALKLLVRASARRSDKVLTVSQSSARDLETLLDVPAAKIAVIPGACDEMFRPTPGAIDLPSPYILYVAAGRAYKNVDGLIRAFAQLQRAGLQHALVITGLAGRATPSLAALIRTLDVRNVVFSGFLDDHVLPLLYSAADVFVYPSFYEGFGLPVLEAMACGTPVAASNRTSLPEAVGDAGLLFDPDDIDAMAGAIDRIVTDRTLHATLRAKGLERAKQFTWETTASRTLAALTELA